MSSEIDNIYVSYAREDNKIVAPFVHDLQIRLRQYVGQIETGVWLDSSNIIAGSNWQKELQRALTEARAMLAIVSPSYLRSVWAQKEYHQFTLSGRPIFAVVLQEFHPNKEEIRKLLGDQVWYVAPRLRRRNASYMEFITDLARDIVTSLQSAAPGPAPAPPQISQEPVTEVSTHKPANKGYVFLSYAEEDADFLAKLRAFFGERGYAYWEFETSDRDYQKRIDVELEEVISRAVATVSVLSEAWKASTWSVRELFFSQEIGKPVFLLKAKPHSPMLAIAGLPYIDFTKDSQQAFARLAKELTRAGL